MADFPISSRSRTIPATFRANGNLVAGENLATIVGTATLGQQTFDDVTLTQFATRAVPANYTGVASIKIQIDFEGV